MILVSVTGQRRLQCGNIFKKIILFIYLFLPVLGLHCCAGFCLVAVSQGYSSLRCASFPLQWLHLVQSTGSRLLGLQ